MTQVYPQARCEGCGVYTFVLPEGLPLHWTVKPQPDNLDLFYCGNCAGGA
jgi:hypothetical protein